jgi:acyl carrier protein
LASDLEAALLGFIRTNLVENPTDVESVDQPLMSSGVIDSFALIELALFIEEELGVVIPDPEVTVVNFDTVRLGAATVRRIAEG